LDNSIDVTDICIEKLNQNNIITIPYGDENRASVFTDPLFGIVKQVIIENDGIITEYDIFTQIKINTLNNQVTVTNENDINNKIAQIHSNLKIEYGSILYELPEQKMVVRYLTGKEKVLEIGANIGRNSLVIASILGNDNQRNFVSLECDTNIANQLTHNRELNNFNFHIESSALSNRKLIQKGWDTKPSETLEEGFTWVKTITLAELKNKYNIEFDTLVLDCEGAFYYILMDMPELLNNINLIIMENDYWEIDKKNYIDDILKQNNFYVDYVESGGWGPCYSNFFEVWKKMC
jgi:FkbM family methyltransferase